MGAWQDLMTVAPGAGLGGMVLALTTWTFKTGREDRAEYRDALRLATADHRQVLLDERTRAAEDRATAEAEISDLRRRLADAQTVADAERAERREAEFRCERAEGRLADAHRRPGEHEGATG